MEEPPAAAPSWLQSVGLVRIWLFIIFFGPLTFLLFAWALFEIWRYQRDWKRSKAHLLSTNDAWSFEHSVENPMRRVATEPQLHPTFNISSPLATCRYPVVVDDLLGSYQLDVRSRACATTPDADMTWDVTYDPKDPRETLTSAIFTKQQRTLTLIGVAAMLIFFAAFYVFNFKFRNDPTWENASGVFFLFDLAGNSMRAFNA
jgi:hypothetical protein